MPRQISGVRSSARTIRLTSACSARVRALAGGGLLMSMFAFLGVPVGLRLRRACDSWWWDVGPGRCDECVVAEVGGEPVQQIGQLRSLLRRHPVVEATVEGGGGLP